MSDRSNLLKVTLLKRATRVNCSQLTLKESDRVKCKEVKSNRSVIRSWALKSKSLVF